MTFLLINESPNFELLLHFWNITLLSHSIGLFLLVRNKRTLYTCKKWIIIIAQHDISVFESFGMRWWNLISE